MRKTIDLIIDKKSVMEKDIGKYISFFNSLLSDKKTVLKARWKLRIRFDGFTSKDPDFHEIPEVVEFLKSLDRIFPYWFFFIPCTDDFYYILILCLCRYSVGDDGEIYFSKADLQEFMTSHLKYIKTVGDEFNLSKKLITRMIEVYELHYLNALLKDYRIHNKLDTTFEDIQLTDLPPIIQKGAGICLPKAVLDDKIGEERMIIIYDEEYYISQLSNTYPFKFFYKPGIIKTKHGPVMFNLCYVENPDSKSNPIFMTDYHTNPLDNEDIRIWYELAMQTHIHIALVTNSGEVMGFYELPNNFIKERGLDELREAASAIEMVDFKKALEEYYEKYSLYDLFTW